MPVTFLISLSESLMWQLSESDIKKVTGVTAFKAARQNDKTALEVLNYYI